MAILFQSVDPAAAKAHFQKQNDFYTGPAELSRVLDKDQVVVVDLRHPSYYEKSRIPGAINLPSETWDKPVGLSKDKTNVLYCYFEHCQLAAEAAIVFAGMGYPVMQLVGGFEGWRQATEDWGHVSAGLKVETSPKVSKKAA